MSGPFGLQVAEIWKCNVMSVVDCLEIILTFGYSKAVQTSRITLKE